MKVLYFSILSFSAAWLIHLFFWRIKRPKKQTSALLVIFISVFISILVSSLLSLLPPLSLVEMVQTAVFYIPAMLAYICFYSAIEENSPSVGLIELTKAKKKCVLSDYYSVINNEILVDSRLFSLIRDGLLIQNNEDYELTTKGLRVGNLFCLTFQCLQLNEGG